MLLNYTDMGIWRAQESDMKKRKQNIGVVSHQLYLEFFSFWLNIFCTLCL